MFVLCQLLPISNAMVFHTTNNVGILYLRNTTSLLVISYGNEKMIKNDS